MEKLTGEQLEDYLRRNEDNPAALPSDDETARPSPLPPDFGKLLSDDGEPTIEEN